MNNTITISTPLPQDIPAPKFSLFQQVTIKGNDKERIGTITGMEYVTPFTAIANRQSTYGWVYEIDFYFGADYKELLHADEYETTDSYREVTLCAKEAK